MLNKCLSLALPRFQLVWEHNKCMMEGMLNQYTATRKFYFSWHIDMYVLDLLVLF